MSANNTKEEYTDDIINLVIARLQALPSNVSISIGRVGNSEVEEDYKVAKLIEHVKANDEIGKKIMEIQLAYIRSFKSS